MPPRALSFPAPSRSLLRYLRAQSEGFAFLDASNSLNRASSAPLRCPLRSSTGRVKQTSRAFSTPISTPKHPRSVDLQAGVLNIDAILPKFLRKPRRTATTSEASVLAANRRYASDDHTPSVLCRPSWQERLWGRQASRSASEAASRAASAAANYKPEDFPGSGPGNIFSASRTQAAKAALEPRLRCTEVDENGEVIMVDGEFKKSELIAKYGLLPRDLRKIDASNLPHILVRPQAILLNLLHLKVLIKFDRVLLFDVYGSKTSYPQSAFLYDLQAKLQQKQTPSAGGLPYEFRALEAVLTSVTSELEAEFETVQAPVIRILSELEDDIDRDKLRILLVLSKKVSSFEQKAKLVRDAIEELLEADDDLSAMYLTEKAHDIYRPDDDHTEIEMLLEAYDRVCDEVAQEASNLVSSIRNTEEIIRAILDSNRNSLMLLDLKFSVGTLGLAMGTFLAGLYGMNLENFIEETNWGFGSVTGISALASLLVCWYGLVKLRKVQRVKILSSRTQDPNHWFREDGAGGLLDARNREKLRQINMLKATYKKKAWFRM